MWSERVSQRKQHLISGLKSDGVARKNGVWEDGHFLGLRGVPGTSCQMTVHSFTQERIQAWDTVKWKHSVFREILGSPPTFWPFMASLRTVRAPVVVSFSESESESRSVVSDSLWPYRLYTPWNSPGQDTGVGSLSLLQRIFLTQKSNRGLLHCRQILYQLSYQGSWYHLDANALK